MESTEPLLDLDFLIALALALPQGALRIGIRRGFIILVGTVFYRFIEVSKLIELTLKYRKIIHTLMSAIAKLIEKIPR